MLHINIPLVSFVKLYSAWRMAHLHCLDAQSAKEKLSCECADRLLLVPVRRPPPPPSSLFPNYSSFPSIHFDSAFAIEVRTCQPNHTVFSSFRRCRWSMITITLELWENLWIFRHRNLNLKLIEGWWDDDAGRWFHVKNRTLNDRKTSCDWLGCDTLQLWWNLWCERHVRYAALHAYVRSIVFKRRPGATSFRMYLRIWWHKCVECAK